MPELIAAPALRWELREAVTEILETMFFIHILEDEPAAKPVSGDGRECILAPSIAACVNFHGEPSGIRSQESSAALARPRACSQTPSS